MSRRWLLVAGLLAGALVLVRWRMHQRPPVGPPPSISAAVSRPEAAPEPKAAPAPAAPDAAPGPRHQPSTMATIEAAFIRHFVAGIVWPPAKLGAPGTPLELCVAGESDVAEALERAVQHRAWQQYPSRVRRVPSQEAAATYASCHLLFIPHSAAPSLDALIAATRDRPILTIGDGAGFGERGVHVNFSVRDHRIAFAMNVPALARSDLHVANTKLLRLGDLGWQAGSPGLVQQ